MRLRPPRTPDPEELVTLHINVEKEPPRGLTRKILLLEDRNDFSEVLRDYLVSCSYRVVSVNSGIDGLREIMNRGGFDFILCDMMMPRIGGRDVLLGGYAGPAWYSSAVYFLYRSQE
jgi:PleD family two-component response regulator